MCIFNSGLSKNGDFGEVRSSAWSIFFNATLHPNRTYRLFPTYGTVGSHRCHTTRPSRTLLSHAAAPHPRAADRHRPSHSRPTAALSLAPPPPPQPPSASRRRRQPGPVLPRGRAGGRSDPAAGARENCPAGTASRPGPSPQRFLPGFPERGRAAPPPQPAGSGPRAGGQAPARTGAAGPFPPPRHQRRAGVPRPPQVEGGLRPFPGRPRLLAPAPRCGQRSAGCLPNHSTFLPRARYVTGRGGRENVRARQGRERSGGGGGRRTPGSQGSPAAPQPAAAAAASRAARPAPPSPGRRGRLGVTFRRAAGS